MTCLPRLGILVICSMTLAIAMPVALPALAARPAPQAEEALKFANLAKMLYQKGQHAAAADLYRKAFRLDPSKPDYLYGVGKSEQKAGRSAQAKAALEQLLALIPDDEELAKRARKALEDLAIADRPAAAPLPVPVAPQVAAPSPPSIAVEPTPPPEPISVPKPPLAPSADQSQPPVATVDRVTRAPQANWPAWSLLGTAAVGVVGAGILTGLAVAADHDADKYRVAGTAQFDPARISQTEATERIAAINGRRVGAVVCAGVAAAAGIAGAWLMLGAKGPAIDFDRRQVTMAWRF